jgi:hypothetical protein
MAEVVDGVDRAFGEARVDDRERIVRARIGGSLELRENNDASPTVPVSLRVPLPALERRSNIFLQFESTADASEDLEQARTSFDEGKSFSATILTRRTPRLETGARLELYWKDGPQTGLRPFLRLERDLDPIRLFFEQQLYYRTDDRGGAKGIFGVDRIFGDSSFVRFTTSVDGNHGTSGTSFEHVLGYRRRLPFPNGALAAEIGTSYNTYHGDPESHDPGSENDPDEAYTRLHLIGRVIRPWVEFELIPAVHFPWHHGDKMEFGVTFILRAVFERNLPGPAEPGEPGGQPEPAASPETTAPAEPAGP